MDIIVAGIPPKFGMLISNSWMVKLQGAMQIDMSSITILFFGGQTRRLYKEPLMKYMITNKEKPSNHLVYVVHSNLVYFILFYSICFDEEEKNTVLL